MSLIGVVDNGTRRIEVLDDMGDTAYWGEARIAICVMEGRIGLNRVELAAHIEHCQAALAVMEATRRD